MIGRMRGLLRALGWGAVLAATAGIAAHYSGLVSNLASRLAAFTPVLIIVGVVGLLLLLAARAWLSAAGAVLVIAVGVTAQAPLYRGAPPPTARESWNYLMSHNHDRCSPPAVFECR
ncbi:hypothetical protein [Gordonia sp. p3-SID1431]|uniref:hypothetical protein n=1 Tax=Gordonia sp. p3-SID1431 TaxID=2916159 RepID=UPI0021A962AA|nr:hypothetical protein [Gordonia sp. p3-SID1431]MCT1352491.1 hypothetical protein [Gordonia sp. p3-SID1431]